MDLSTTALLGVFGAILAAAVLVLLVTSRRRRAAEAEEVARPAPVTEELEPYRYDFFASYDLSDAEVREPTTRTRSVWAVVLVVLLVFVCAAVVAQATEAIDRVVGQTETTTAPSPDPTARPYVVVVDATPETTPEPTPEPTPEATPRRTKAPERTTAPASEATPAPSSTLSVDASASCSGGTLTVSYSLSSEAGLRWRTVYVDGESVQDGPITGTERSGSHEMEATDGGHDVEVVATDASGAREADRTRASC